MHTNIKHIELTKGRVAIVDIADYAQLSQYKWHFNSGYAARRFPISNGKQAIEYMHRRVANPPEGMEADHINGNGLDNRQINLRICNHAKNMMNRKVNRNSSTGFKGVSFDGKRYRATIYANNKAIELGRFATAELAAEAYKNAATIHHGEFQRS